MLPQGEHKGPYLFAAKALVPGMLLQGLIWPNSLSQGTTHPIRVVSGKPDQSLQSESILLQHQQSDSIRVDSSLLHIITYYKDYNYF